MVSFSAFFLSMRERRDVVSTLLNFNSLLFWSILLVSFLLVLGGALAAVIGACITLTLVLLHGTALFNPTLQFAFTSQTRDPFPVDVNKITKELGIPTTELTHNGSLLDGLLALGQRLIGDFGTIFLHDANHISVIVMM